MGKKGRTAEGGVLTKGVDGGRVLSHHIAFAFANRMGWWVVVRVRARLCLRILAAFELAMCLVKVRNEGRRGGLTAGGAVLVLAFGGVQLGGQCCVVGTWGVLT